MRIGLSTVAIDLMGAALVKDLERCGISAILLKGPSVAKWLYTDGRPRIYRDIDLLIPPSCFAQAEGRLKQLGFHPAGEVDFPGKAPWIERVWRRPDGTIIDLHRSIQGLRVHPEEAWRIFSERTSPMRIGGFNVPVLDEQARAFHLAIHALQHGSHEKPLDLRRALRRLSRETWDGAAALANQCGALDFFSGGLHLVPEGTDLARELLLPDPVELETLIRMEGAPELARAVDRFFALGGLRVRLKYLWAALFPSPNALRKGNAALEGFFALLRTYLARWGRVLTATPRVLSALMKVCLRNKGRGHNQDAG
jgi:hypothetical protein